MSSPTASSPSFIRAALRELGLGLALVLAYVGLGWLALRIVIPPDYVSLVFLPAGLALGATLVRGRIALPWIGLGSLLVQMLAHWQAGATEWTWTLLIPSSGAMLQAWASRWAIRRWLNQPEAMDRPASVLLFMLLLVPAGAVINAAISLPALVASGVIPRSEAVYSFWSWWLGDTLGTVMLTPVVLAFFQQPASVWRPRVRTVALPMLLALALLSGITSLVRDSHEQAMRSRFARQAQELAQLLQRRLDAQTDGVHAVARAVTLIDHVDEASFRWATEMWLTRYPGMQNLAWSPRVSQADRASHEAKMSARLGRLFRVLGRDEQGHTFPVPIAREYLPMSEVEPRTGNELALGLDVLSMPTTAAVVWQSFRDGGAQVTPVLRLVQEKAAQNAVVMYLAVRSREQPDQLRGLVSAAFRLDDLMDATLGEQAAAELLLPCLVASEPAAAKVSATNRSLATPLAGNGCRELTQSELSPRLLANLPVTFGQVTWTLRVRAANGYLGQSRDWTAWAITASGVASVGLLGAFLLVITGQSRRTQRLVNQRTQELALSNASLTHLAHYDPLTGLYNRSRWMVLAEQALRNAQQVQRSAAVIFIDIDRFKLINDSLGHSQGDELLKTLAQRMRGCVRGGDLLARLGGDEFVLMLTGFSQREGIERVARQLMLAVTQPVPLQDQEVRVTASLGVAFHPDDGATVEQLLQHADIAMYAAKDDGRDSLRFFSDQMHALLSEKLRIERELRRALASDSGELWLAYQPQLALDSRAIVGVEALLRWRHPQMGDIRPDRFIPVAEQCGLIEALGQWVLRQTCLQLSQWDAAGVPPFKVAVNISAMEFFRPRFINQVQETLVETNAPARRIELEITESLLMQAHTDVREQVMALTQLGVSLALDDFGTGYSSLGYLKRLPLAKLKIDRSFLIDVPGKAEDEALVRAIISLAHDLSLEVVAEGVETQAQHDFLLEHGCDQIQGWWLAKALAPDELVEWLSQRQAAGR